MLNLFCLTYNVDKNELTKDLDKFETFQSFFTRPVKDRKIDDNPNNIISPCDSTVLSFSEVKESECLLIKDKKYKLG